MSYPARLARYSAASTSLALLSDRRLGKLLDEAPVIGSGIGGTATLLEIASTRVFVKRIPLTDLERHRDNLRSTANLFQLPTFYQYGVGSAGFGVWRELAAHVMTTNWGLGKQCESFPLMYHWRVLEGPPPRTPTSEDRTALARTVAFWDGSPAVHDRLDAIARSSASVVLFLEYIPQNLIEWLSVQLTGGDAAAEAALAMVERDLSAGVSFMNSSGLLHFDTHFGNILTDGQRLYFADFGLATTTRFDLSVAESDFVGANQSHDECYTMTQLVNWLVVALRGRAERDEVIRRCADGGAPPNGPTAVAKVLKRYAPLAVVMNEFYRKLQFESKTTPFPFEEIRQVCSATGLTLGARP